MTIFTFLSFPPVLLCFPGGAFFYDMKLEAKAILTLVSLYNIPKQKSTLPLFFPLAIYSVSYYNNSNYSRYFQKQNRQFKKQPERTDYEQWKNEIQPAKTGNQRLPDDPPEPSYGGYGLSACPRGLPEYQSCHGLSELKAFIGMRRSACFVPRGRHRAF